MARGFRRRGKGADLRYAAKLDDAERSLVVGLMEQVRDMLVPDGPAAVGRPTGDAAFDAIVADLQGLEVELGADSPTWPDPGPIPETARSFGPRDPALERLLPVGNRADDQVAAEYRRLTEDGLRRRKIDQLESSMAALRRASPGTVELDERAARTLLVALTDVRLVLGERLGLREDDDVNRLEASVADLGERHPLAFPLAVYEFLTWLQETLAAALMPGAGG